MKKKKHYEVWMENGLRIEQWAYFGGVAGPMPKSAADNYVKGLKENGVHAEARVMPQAEILRQARQRKKAK